MEQGHLPFEVGGIPEAFLRKAEQELNEHPAKRMHNIRLMRDMMRRDGAFLGEPFDDRFLLQYLRFRKHDVAKAFAVLRKFVVFRKQNRSMFDDIHFKNIVKLLSEDVATVLPYRCPDGCAIFLVKIANWNPESLCFDDLRRAGMVILSQAIREPLSQITGFKVIIDTESSNPLKHLKYCTFSNLYMMYYGTQETSSGRFKAIHVVNSSIVFRTCWAILRNFLSTKIRSRVHFHSSADQLLDQFPRAVLPVKYGGHLQSYDMTDWFRRTTEYEEMAVLLGKQTKNNE